MRFRRNRSLTHSSTRQRIDITEGDYSMQLFKSHAEADEAMKNAPHDPVCDKNHGVDKNCFNWEVHEIQVMDETMKYSQAFYVLQGESGYGERCYLGGGNSIFAMKSGAEPSRAPHFRYYDGEPHSIQ